MGDVRGAQLLQEVSAMLEAASQTYSWDPVLSTRIRVPQQEDLVFDVTLQCGLYTDTLVKTSGGRKDRVAGKWPQGHRVKKLCRTV